MKSVYMKSLAPILNPPRCTALFASSRYTIVAGLKPKLARVPKSLSSSLPTGITYYDQILGLQQTQGRQTWKTDALTYISCVYVHSPFLLSHRSGLEAIDLSAAKCTFMSDLHEDTYADDIRVRPIIRLLQRNAWRKRHEYVGKGCSHFVHGRPAINVVRCH